MRVFLVAALTAFLTTATPSVASNLEATLRLDPASDLPGLPPTMRLELRNLSAEPVTRAPYASLIVKKGEEPPFLAWVAPRGEEVSLWMERSSIAPGGQGAIQIFASLESPPWFAFDPRLYVPGSYAIRMVLSEAPLGDPSVIPPDAVLSNEVFWTVKQPSGADAEVWKAIRELKEPLFWSESLARRIWDEYPDSAYAAWAVPRSKDLSAHIRNLQRAIALDPAGRMSDWHRYLEANLYLRTLALAVRERKTEDAIQAAASARQLLERLRSSENPEIRTRAVEDLERDVPSHEEILKKTREKGKHDAEVVPYANCLQKEGEEAYLWFGYSNSGSEVISISVGENNQFTPAPHDRGQPLGFAPGIHQLSFRVRADSPVLTWHLDRKPLVVKITEVGACTAENFEFYRRRWPDGAEITQ